MRTYCEPQLNQEDGSQDSDKQASKIMTNESNSSGFLLGVLPSAIQCAHELWRSLLNRFECFRAQGCLIES